MIIMNYDYIIYLQEKTREKDTSSLLGFITVF